MSQQQRVLFVCGRNRSRSPTAERTEPSHQRTLMQRFGAELRGKTMHGLDIPDEYALMDAELVELLELGITPLLAHD